VRSTQGSARKVVGSGYQDHIRIPGELGDAEAAAGDEQRHEDVVGRVHDQRGALEVLAVAQGAQEVGLGQGLAAHQAVLVRPGHPHLLKLAAVEASDDLLEGIMLPFAVQTVLSHETGLADAEVLT